jgi:signal transduction histidine kinase
MSRTRPRWALSAYVGAWVAAMLGVTAWAALRASAQSLDLNPLLVLTLMVAAAELTVLHFRHSNGSASGFTLIEAAATAALLLMPPSQAVLAVTGGALLANLLRRRTLIKIAYNTSQVAVSILAAVGVLTVLPELGPVVGRHGIVTVSLAMVVYVTCNLVALLGLLHLLDADVREILRNQGVFSIMAPLGGLPIGILGAELAETRPELVALLAAPMAAVYLAYRGVARTQELLTQLRQDHDRLDRIVAGTSDGILLLAADGTVEVWNEALTRLTGIPGEAAVGQPVERILAGVRLGDPVTGRWRLAEAGPDTPTLVDQAQLRHLIDGTVRTIRESHTFRFEKGVPVGDVVVVTDVTREQEVAELRNDFVARVSHELRTPLTPIKGFASMLLMKADDMGSDQRRVALERIVERADRMTKLVDDLLLVTELEHTAGRGEPLTGPSSPLVPVDVVRVASEIAWSIGGEFDRDVALEGPDTAHADANPDRLTQALRHLLDNAVRYSSPGTPVTVRVNTDDGRVRIEVADRGRGIPSSEHERVFEPFLRLEDPLRMTTSGVGLGLYIARRMVNEMGGELTLRSRPGSGSTFMVDLRASETAGSTADPATSSVRSGDARRA